MRGKSIQSRLVATVVIVQLALAVGLTVAGVSYTHRRLRATLDASMQARAMSVAALVRYTEDASGNVYFDDSLLPPPIDAAHPDFFAVWAARSGLVTRSPNWPAGLDITALGKGHWNFHYGEVPYRGLRVLRTPVLDREEGKSFQPQTLDVVYVSPRLRLNEQVRQTAIFIAGVSLALLLLTVVIAVWGIRRGLQPLQELAGQAARVTASHWTLPVPAAAEQMAELRPLTESMVHMLARLERSFEQQREFLSSAAHELKTPVAILKSTLQSLLQRPRRPEEYRAGLEHSLEDLQRLEQLLQWMLRLARAEQWAHGALRRDLDVIDVAATCEEALERMRPLAESRRTRLEFSANGAVPLRADPEDLQLVWQNLLENAVRYSPEQSSVQVAIHRDQDRAKIVFQDHGPGIAPADLPHVFERFYRSDRSRARETGGFGLGLAIAKALVEAYGGSIRAESAPGEGTRMIVELPLEVQ